MNNDIPTVILNELQNIDDLAQYKVLEFLGYNYRNGKFICQLPKDMKIYELLLDRPTLSHDYTVSFDIDCFDYHNDRVLKTLEIDYSPFDRNISIVSNRYFYIDYGQLIEYDPDDEEEWWKGETVNWTDDANIENDEM
jgi:hypothetical protein